jgi:hypothetical protein
MGWEWMAFPDAGLVVSIGAMDDALARMMLMAVSGVGLLIPLFLPRLYGRRSGAGTLFRQTVFLHVLHAGNRAGR